MIKSLRELIADEGNYKCFEYKGYICEIIRHDILGHLCGYIKGEFNERELEILDLCFHGGVTYNTNAKTGFDCGQTGDLIPYSVFTSDEVLEDHEQEMIQIPYVNQVYRDFNYVESNLKNTIEMLKENA